MMINLKVAKYKQMHKLDIHDENREIKNYY
jgi:hypothetical protein